MSGYHRMRSRISPATRRLKPDRRNPRTAPPACSAPSIGLMYMGMWTTGRYSNRLDGGAFYYGSYQCSDDKYVSIGSLEPQFYALLPEKCGIDDDSFRQQTDQAAWPEKRSKLEALFKTRTRGEWCELLEGADVCFAPVLDLAEAPTHPHNKARDTFVDVEGVTQPAGAIREPAP